MKNILSIFVKLKSKFSREIILIIFEKILKIGSHLHSLKDDFDLRLQDRKKDLSLYQKLKPLPQGPKMGAKMP